jgi:hypothetical protein
VTLSQIRTGKISHKFRLNFIVWTKAGASCAHELVFIVKQCSGGQASVFRPPDLDGLSFAPRFHAD